MISNNLSSSGCPASQHDDPLQKTVLLWVRTIGCANADSRCKFNVNDKEGDNISGRHRGIFVVTAAWETR